MIMQALPYDILQAMIQCFGRCFYYKDEMTSFLLTVGVERSLVDKYRSEAKFVWARHLLTELAQSERGRLLQRKILTELCNLKDVPDPNVPDRNAGVDALRGLKELAVQRDMVAREERKKGDESARLSEERARVVSERAGKLARLHRQFTAAVTSADRQTAGYTLEDLLQELFALFEIDYRKSYRTDTQQIDGHFAFHNFDYLVEAKWRQDKPTEQEIGGFKHKVDSKLESTRGLFVSIPGFREEVVTQFNGKGANIILMDGMDLTHILEGRADLRDALHHKIERAAQEGVVFTSIYGP